MLSQQRARFHVTYIRPEANHVDIEDKEIYCEPDEELQIRQIKEEDELHLVDKIESFRNCETTRFYWMIAKLIETGKTQREISRVTGIPRTSVSRAVKKLRALLNEGNTTGSLRGLDMGSQAKSA